MTPATLARSIEEFLAEAPNSVVIEDGQVAFDLGAARYSISSEHGKCLLHLWSEERNAVRRVLDSEIKNGVLRLQVQKFGAARPHKLEICRERDRRTPAAKKVCRTAYQRLLERMLQRSFPDFAIERISSAMDLERSFGPVYTRALIRKGRSSFAVIGVNAQETQSSIDAALTFGLLWLDLCREREGAMRLVEGLKLILPRGSSAVARARIANLNHSAAKFHLYELEERGEELTEFDATDSGNIETRLAHNPGRRATRERFAAAIARIAQFVPEAEVVVTSATEVAFRLNGLEFARARVGLAPGSFRHSEEIVFGAGPYETTLSGDNATQFSELMARVAAARHPSGEHKDPIWRMHPERWLESKIVSDVSQFDSQLDPAHVYSQVPAFAASDRAMIDVLTSTRSGRLVVLELKANEDIHLVLQGLDYWARVRWHHQRGEFQKFGYFTGKELSADVPLLFLVAPALRIHPATDALMRHLSPNVDCTLIGIDENWRADARVIFRKTRKQAMASG